MFKEFNSWNKSQYRIFNKLHIIYFFINLKIIDKIIKLLSILNLILIKTKKKNKKKYIKNISKL